MLGKPCCWKRLIPPSFPQQRHTLSSALQISLHLFYSSAVCNQRSMLLTSFSQGMRTQLRAATTNNVTFALEAGPETLRQMPLSGLSSVVPYSSAAFSPSPFERQDGAGDGNDAGVLSLLLCSCRKSYPHAWGGPKGPGVCPEAEGHFHMLLNAESCAQWELRQLWCLPALRGRCT